jgi:hypothetical protein
MESVYHIVTIHVNETSWAHIWRLRSRYLGTGYDRLVIVEAIVIMVPLITLFLLITLSISAPVFDPAECISDVNDIAQVTVVSIVLWATLLWWSDAIGRVPTRTLLVVIFVTSVSVLLIMDWVC